MGLSIAVSGEPQQRPPAEMILEQVEVTATHNPFSKLASTNYAIRSVTPEEQTQSAGSLTEMLSGVTGMAENGQPGLFQVTSIRGVSRQRVLTLVDGVRITSERRAGVDASFVDPLLLERADVLRGPSSTLYGSGALGGVLQLVPRHFTHPQLHLGLKSEGEQRVAQAGWGNEQWSLAAAHRKGDNSEDIDGNELNTGYSQSSVIVQWQGNLGAATINALYLPARGKDIGRSNARYPDRIVGVPEKNHDIFSVSVSAESGIHGKLYLHDQNMITETLRPSERLNAVYNESFDYGGYLQKNWSDENTASLLGVELFKRSGVSSSEREWRIEDGAVVAESLSERFPLNDASKDEWAVYGSWIWQGDDARVQLGSRYTWQKDRNRPGDNQINSDVETSVNDYSNNSLTGFIGWSQSLSDHWTLSANLGSGFRFASLTEKFYTGTTGRGTVVGNPNLSAERALNLDVGAHWQGENDQFHLIVFNNDIDNYIERVALQDEQLTYVNLDKGNIKGIELEYARQWAPAWRTSINGAVMEGKNQQGDPLADIPGSRVRVRNSYETDDWSVIVDWQHRGRKSDPGASEMQTPSADLLSLRWQYALSRNLSVAVFFDNLLNERYYRSADDLGTLEPGLEGGLEIQWRNLGPRMK